MTASTTRTLAVLLLAFLLAHLTAVVTRQAAASDGTGCDSECTNWNMWWDCSGNFYMRTWFGDCVGCRNKGDTDCLRPTLNQPCERYPQPGQKFNINLDSTGGGTKEVSCNCGTGILYITATSFNLSTAAGWQNSPAWNTCNGLDPGGGGTGDGDGK